MDRRGSVARADTEPVSIPDALLEDIADAFEATDVLYPQWLDLVNQGRLDEAFVLVLAFGLGMT